MISVELNTAIKAKFTALGSPYSTISILPLAGYEDTVAPFIIYTEFTGTMGEEKFFMGVSNVVYTIYDDDISRLKDVGYELNKFLNVGDRLSVIKPLLTSPYTSGPLRYRITTIRKVAGGTTPPLEREGRASMSLNFRVVYLEDGGSIT